MDDEAARGRACASEGTRCVSEGSRGLEWDSSIVAIASVTVVCSAADIQGWDSRSQGDGSVVASRPPTAFEPHDSRPSAALVELCEAVFGSFHACALACAPRADTMAGVVWVRAAESSRGGAA